MRHLVASGLLVLAAAQAAAQPAAQPPAPLFAPAPITGLCGALADHERLLAREGFEPAWRGTGGPGPAAQLHISGDGYWMLLLIPEGAPDRACVVADGPRFEYDAGRAD
jgi:hypothetical protein